MSTSDEKRSAAAAIAAAAEWRQSEEARINGELSEVDQELARLAEAISNLQQQVASLGAHRAEIAAQAVDFDAAQAERAYASLFATLGEQAAALAARGEEIAAAEREQAAAIEAAVSEPSTKALLDQFKAFKTTVEPSLAAMPEAYRSAILAAHEHLSAQLREKMASVDQSPVVHPGPELVLDILFAVDAPDGSAEMLMLVLPVPEGVQAEWAVRQDDAPLRVAARVAQGVYQACAGLGAPHAQAMFGGHQGLLAMELELPGGAPERVEQAVKNAIDAALSAAPELTAGKVIARAFPTAVDYLLPPEGDEIGEGDDVG